MSILNGLFDYTPPGFDVIAAMVDAQESAYFNQWKVAFRAARTGRDKEIVLKAFYKAITRTVNYAAEQLGISEFSEFNVFIEENEP